LLHPNLLIFKAGKGKDSLDGRREALHTNAHLLPSAALLWKS